MVHLHAFNDFTLANIKIMYYKYFSRGTRGISEKDALFNTLVCDFKQKGLTFSAQDVGVQYFVQVFKFLQYNICVYMYKPQF
jgi:hypothetical protein